MPLVHLLCAAGKSGKRVKLKVCSMCVCAIPSNELGWSYLLTDIAKGEKRIGDFFLALEGYY